MRNPTVAIKRNSPSEPKVIELRPAEKYAFCLECDRFKRFTKRCSECGCFMPLKVRVPGQHCPIDKW
jgi:hypothetical protein